MGTTNMKFIESKDETTFDFPSLPYVCQKRFAEICEPKNVKSFAQINAPTRKLTKRCHVIDEFSFTKINLAYKYKILCYCEETEFCKGVNEADIFIFKKKPEIIGTIDICKENGDQTIDAAILQRLPVSFNSCEQLFLNVDFIELEDLKKMITPRLKTLIFYGGIRSNCNMEEFICYIKTLSKLDVFGIFIYRPLSRFDFELNDLIQQQLPVLQSQKIIYNFLSNCVYISLFTKNYC